MDIQVVGEVCSQYQLFPQPALDVRYKIMYNV